MAIVVELEALLISAGYTPFLWTIAACLAMVAFLMIRRGVTTFNRETILARDHARFDGRRLRRSFKRFLWEYQPAGVPLDHYQGTFSLQSLLSL